MLNEQPAKQALTYKVRKRTLTKRATITIRCEQKTMRTNAKEL